MSPAEFFCRGFCFFVESSLQVVSQFFQCPFFDSGYIASADTGNQRRFPLSAGWPAIQPIAQPDYLPLLIRQAGIHGPIKLLHRFLCSHLLQKIPILTDHIHQRQRRPITAALNIVRQGYILGALTLGPKVHQDLIFHTSGGIGGKAGTFGAVKGGHRLDQTDGADGDQILLIRRLGIVFLEGLMLAGRSRGE